MLKELFALPQHNEVNGICFRCPCTPATMREVGLSASWTQRHYDDWSFMTRFLMQGRLVSPVFGIPCFKPGNVIRLDWLHVVDLGVAADTAGQILWQVQLRLPGSNVAERLKALFLEMKGFYGESHSPDQLNTLTETMIRKDSRAAPKLKAKGAEVRKLIPFLVEIANRYLVDPAKPEDEAQRKCVRHLLDCYEALTEPYSRDDLMLAGRLFASQAVALEAYFDDGVTWRTKPKMHLFMHLIESHANPSTIWCYRDEDYGGAAANAVRMKGGWNTAPSSSQQVLDKFRAKHQLPCIM